MKKPIVKRVKEKIERLNEKLPQLSESWMELKRNPRYSDFNKIWSLVEKNKKIIQKSKVSYPHFRADLLESFIWFRLKAIHSDVRYKKIELEGGDGSLSLLLRMEGDVTYPFKPDFIFFTFMNNDDHVLLYGIKPIRLLIAIECKTHIDDKTHYSRPALDSLYLKRVSPITTFIVLSKTNIMKEEDMKTLSLIGADFQNYQVDNVFWEKEIRRILNSYCM